MKNLGGHVLPGCVNPGCFVAKALLSMTISLKPFSLSAVPTRKDAPIDSKNPCESPKSVYNIYYRTAVTQLRGRMVKP